MRMSECLDLLIPALHVFQAQAPTVPKNSTNPFYNSKYASMDDCVQAAKPGLDQMGLAVSQFPSTVDGKPALTTILVHTSGQWIADDAVLVLAKDDPQGQGGAITYMRRYAYCAVLGLVADEDDDGNAASQHSQQAHAPRQSSPAGQGEGTAVRGASSPIPTGGSGYNGSPSRLRSDAQGKALYAIFQRRGEDLTAYVREQYGIESDDLLTVKEASEIIELFGQARR